MTRETTAKLIDEASEGMLSWEAIARACLGYMSEDEVKDMAEAEGLIDSEDDSPEPEEFEFSDEDEVNEAFAEQCPLVCSFYPTMSTDKPAKREAFAGFVDNLQRGRRISDELAQSVTLQE